MPFCGCCRFKCLERSFWWTSFLDAFFFLDMHDASSLGKPTEGGLRQRTCATRCPYSTTIFRVPRNKRLLPSSDLLSCGEDLFMIFCFFGFCNGRAGQPWKTSCLRRMSMKRRCDLQYALHMLHLFLGPDVSQPRALSHSPAHPASTAV